MILQISPVAPRQYDNIGTLLLSVVAFIFLALLCRWVFSTKERDARTLKRKKALEGNYGLLMPVFRPKNLQEAYDLQTKIKMLGLRTTVSTDFEGPVLLAFPRDADELRDILISLHS